MSQSSRTKNERADHKRAWRIQPNEEFVWTMRTYKMAGEQTNRALISSDVENETTTKELAKAMFSSSQLEMKKVKILASFLPDEVLLNMEDYSPREIECCLLYGRITGMHSLIERYQKMKADSRLKLGSELIQFFGNIVHEILSNGGDVLKFTPTAIIAVWKCTKENFIAQNVHIAIDCALVIQKQHGKFVLHSGQELNVDFAITAGTVYFSLIGNEICSKFLVFGQIYEDVRKARKMFNDFGVIVSSKAMQCIHSFEYITEPLKNTKYSKVIGLTKMWKQARKTEYHERQPPTLEVDVSSIDLPVPNTHSISINENKDAAEFFSRPVLEDLLENPSFFHKNGLKFFPEHVSEAILNDEPIENCMALREVVVLTVLIETSTENTVKMLKTTDEMFNLIHRHSVSYKGYPNYASIIEKSTMIKIVFGLKGTTHVMQHRSALKCANEIMLALKTAVKVTSVNIGVSSGTAYYTIIGNFLRQDMALLGKTVIGSMALSMSYPDKIVCDEDTFIQSRMNQACFDVLQEGKSNVENLPSGLIYELLAIEKDSSNELPSYDQPVIGRDREINIFVSTAQKFFGSTTNNSKSVGKYLPNALYVTAYPKEGKTKLLQEMIRLTDPKIPVLYVPLNDAVKDIPFYLIHKIFSTRINCELSSSTMEERRKELKDLLVGIPRPELAWAINAIFVVNFPETEEFWKYSAKEKSSLTMKFLEYLCSKIFRIKWLIVVDDADYLDSESFSLIEKLLETSSFFLVMSMNKDRSLNDFEHREIENKSKVRKIEIGAMDRNYIGGLICQHFRVFAVSCDLIYFMQKKFRGNIGYINNCLTNLLQKGELIIKEVLYNEMVEENLINPPVNFIIPLTHGEKRNLMRLIPRKGKYDRNEFKRILWHLFIGSFDDRKFHQESAKVIYKTLLKSDTIRVCTILVEKISMERIPVDLTRTIRFHQIFEWLTYTDQFILKCCSTLHDTFSRSMVEHLLPLEYFSLLPDAVKTFFEMGILCCGRGDFTDGVHFRVMREKIQDPRLVDDISCKCRSVYVPEHTLKILPDYAFCGLLRFRHTYFREFIYGQLLRDEQKRDFHAKTIIFLQEETKRCASCGRHSFDWNTGKRMDDYRKIWRKSKTPKKISSKSDEFTHLNTTMGGLIYGNESSLERFSSASSITTSKASFNSSFCLENDIPLENSPLINIKKVFGPMKLKKMKRNLSLVRTFSANDFSTCECQAILGDMYQNMIIHCKGAGNFKKLYEFLLRYAYQCITLKNESEAQLILTEAMSCVNDMFECQQKPSPPSWKRKLLEGKILNVRALAYSKMGSHTTAVECLKQATEKLCVKLPKSNLSKLVQMSKMKIWKFLTLYAFPELGTKNLGSDVCEYYVNIAETMNLLAMYLMAKGQWLSAEVVATRALRWALNAQTSFIGILDSYTNMIFVTLHNKNLWLYYALKIHALRFCYRKMNRMESWELKAVCRMYMAIVIGKFIRAEIDYSLHMGYIILKMAASLNDSEKLLMAASYLVVVLIAKLFLQEATSLLFELEYCSENMDDIPGQIWFHSQALLFHIEIGYCIVPFEQCKFFLEMKALNSQDTAAVSESGFYRLTTLMWLWSLRNEEWEIASRFDEYISHALNTRPITVRTVLTFLYILEGFLLLYVHKLNRNNWKEAQNFKIEVKRLIKDLEKETDFMIIFKTRLFTLKAYYFLIENDRKNMEKWLDKANKIAVKQGLFASVEWSIHLRKAWNHELSKKRMNFWKDHCVENNIAFYNEYDMIEKNVGYFTLPEPLYS